MGLKNISIWAVVAALVSSVLLAGILITRSDVFFAGHVLFGLSIGLMVGMTQSAVVSAALPLLFTFAGGSIVTLSIGETRTDAQLETLGMQLAGFAIGTIVGILAGVMLRKANVELPLGKFSE